MKKYVIISSLINILLSLGAVYGFLHYLVFSASHSLSVTIDLLVLIIAIIVNIALNYLLFKIMKKKENKIFVLIPTCVFMISTGLLLFFIN